MSSGIKRGKLSNNYIMETLSSIYRKEREGSSREKEKLNSNYINEKKLVFIEKN